MYARVLVPLDGSAVAEVVLPHVEQLAAALGSEVVLFQVVPLPQAIFDQGGQELISADALIASATGVANDYLAKVSLDLANKGIKSVKKEVRVGLPADQIIDYASEINASLIAMATHGRSGVSRWIHGSVAEKVLHGATVPVLLIRAGKESMS